MKIAEPAGEEHIGVRLFDKEKKLYLTETEPQGKAAGVLPFLIRTPDHVESVTPELVLLPRVKAEFLVETPAEKAQ